VIQCRSNDVSTNTATMSTDVSPVGETERVLRLWDLALGVASCGHDLNNWLTVALSNLELAQAELEHPSDELARCHAAIHGAIALMQQAMRGGGADEASCDVAGSLQGVLRLVGSLWPTQHVVAAELPPLPSVAISRRDLQRVLLNLLMNAMAAVPADGTVTLRAWPERETVVVEVRDTGPGFAKIALGEQVQPFVSSVAAGFGLGLAGSALLVRRIGGRLVLDKEREGGAIVRITLPMAVSGL